MRISLKKVICSILFYLFAIPTILLLQGCEGCGEEAVEGGAIVGDYAVISNEITLSELETVGLEFNSAINAGAVVNEDAFISALQKVKLEDAEFGDNIPKLYVESNEGKEYFGEIVKNDFGETEIHLQSYKGESKVVTIPKKWTLYNVVNDNVQINIKDNLGTVSVYRAYKLNTNSIVLVLKKIGEFYEIQLPGNIIGWVATSSLALITTSKHVVVNPLPTAVKPPSTINNQYPSNNDQGRESFHIFSPPPYSVFDYPRYTPVYWTLVPNATSYVLQVEVSNSISPYDSTDSNYSPMPNPNRGFYPATYNVVIFQGIRKNTHRFRVIAKNNDIVIAMTPWEYITYLR